MQRHVADVKAVDGVDFEVRRGETLGLVGESGSGKSVTALAVLQLLPVPPAIYRSGSILLNINNEQCNVLQLSEEKLRTIRGSQVAMIFQEPMTSLNPVLTCGFQVLEAIRQHSQVTYREAILKTLGLFENVGLPDPPGLYSRYPHQLSGGQKQRVMIAMAMSGEPALLICDEPTTALDVTVQKNILLLIRQLQQRNNMGVVFITHDFGVVAEIADRVAVMYKGSIVEENTTQQIFRSPQHPYTKALLACRPILHKKGERLPVVSDFLGEKSEVRGEKPGVIRGSSSRTPRSSLLSVKDLKVWYAGKKTIFGKISSYTKAVDGVSFDVQEGETLGLVGESGSGKSTLGRAILRLIDPVAGSVIYKGINLLETDNRKLRALRKDMQLIFQDPYSSLNPRISIGEAIAEPLAVHDILRNAKDRKNKVIELLEKVNLGAEHYHRYPHEFSGGQRQRIVIARALAVEPSFIVCDESVAALDVSVQAQVLNLLNDLKREFGFTVIFISHDLSVVRYISDRIMVMHKGIIVETGTAEQVYRQPENEYTRQLIASIPKAVF
ncbi:MAG: ABC transporter ATP-binding protein [Sediminibacterium sp.]